MKIAEVYSKKVELDSVKFSGWSLVRNGWIGKFLNARGVFARKKSAVFMKV